MFERRVVFGKKQATLGDPREPVRPAPGADGAAPAFHRRQWEDPRIGPMLRDAGFAPDDAASIVPTADNRLAVFAAANQRLQERTESFNRDMTRATATAMRCRSWSSTTRSGTGRMARFSTRSWI
ncbi:hypothetical protein H8B02_23935 [Bradyrhizobium sp. Pear77]|uniref:hypothetical protein n=1 Tax=Bradyrhizobium altum TaxID=1571202 RepID=UPI001E4B62F0|nr:hypothetical protein [Bradyrhizobium altum]MCC8956364.1 hypothetical protein [Bradyrhizobium altum]